MLKKFRIGGFNIVAALLISLLAALIAGCHDGSGASSDEAVSRPESLSPPSGLSYSNSAAVYVAGTAIVPNTPSSSGGPIEQYHVSPTLPAGLVLHSTTGAISGTPTTVAAATTYTVTGKNRAGATTARLDIEIKSAAIAPERLTYRNSAAVYTQGVEIEPNVPEASGGEITGFSVSPPLPAGLGLDLRTGVISGVPTALSAPTIFTVTGSNIAGSAQTQLSIEIRKRIMPPSSLVYSDPKPVYVVGQPIVPNEPQSTGGAITRYSAWPALPTGLELNAGTGVISGTPAATQEDIPYMITGSNGAGSVKAQVDVTVTPAPAEWRPGGSMMHGRRDHTATLLEDGKVLVVGGQNYKAELYDPLTKRWTYAGNKRLKRFQHTAVRLKNGKVLVAGGKDAFVSAELYDPTKNDWSEAAPMAQSRYIHAATLLSDGNVLVVGGTAYGVPYLNSAERYDPVTNQWSSAGHLQHARDGATAICLKNGKVLVFGGFGKSGQTDGPLSSAELYDPNTNQWSTAGSMAHARTVHAAVLLRDGRVLVVGGSGGTGKGTLSSAELYDPNSNQWSSAGSMAQNRISLTAALLPNGKVLVVGGRGDTKAGYRVLNSAELYDPDTNQWSTTSSMAAPRIDHTSTSLPDGNVLVTGGDNGEDAQSSTELYVP